MQTDETAEYLDWVAPGVKVLLFNNGRTGGPRHLVRSVVDRVTRTTFTVAASDEPRFRFAHRQPNGPGFEVHQGGDWGWRRTVVPLDSEEAREQLTAGAQRKKEAAARNAVGVWQRTPTRDNRLAAIQALQGLEGLDVEPAATTTVTTSGG